MTLREVKNLFTRFHFHWSFHYSMCATIVLTAPNRTHTKPLEVRCSRWPLTVVLAVGSSPRGAERVTSEAAVPTVYPLLFSNTVVSPWHILLLATLSVGGREPSVRTVSSLFVSCTPRPSLLVEMQPAMSASRCLRSQDSMLWSEIRVEGSQVFSEYNIGLILLHLVVPLGPPVVHQSHYRQRSGDPRQGPPKEQWCHHHWWEELSVYERRWRTRQDLSAPSLLSAQGG